MVSSPLALPDFDRISLDDLRGRHSEKWSTYPAEVLPVWVAEMDYPVAEPIERVLRQALEKSDVGYPRDALDEGVPEAFARRMSERFSWSPDPSRVELLADVMQGMYLAVDALTEKETAVVIQTPIYPPFLLAAAENHREIVENRLVHTATGYQIDFDALERDIPPHARMFFLCNPHNPIGRAFTHDELARIGEIACREDLIVVSDEIHADLVYDGGRHIPFATLAPEVAERTLTVTSATKAFNIPGLRLAVAHFGSEDMQRAFNRLPARARGGIGLLGIYATLAAWQEGEPWLDHVRAYLADRRTQLGHLLADKIPEILYRPPEATYLAWLDCSRLELRSDPATVFREQGQVALSPGPNFGNGYEAFARLNFATSAALLSEAVDRMARAIGG